MEALEIGVRAETTQTKILLRPASTEKSSGDLRRVDFAVPADLRLKIKKKKKTKKETNT